MDLSGKVCLVTGSSRGIGSAIARAFAEAGADVVVNHRKKGTSSAKASALVTEIQALGRRALTLRADISIREEVVALFARIHEEFGRLDILVLNAARAPFKPLERLLERELRQLVDTNFIGNILCIREALPMLKTTAGKIVFVSSLGGRTHLPDYPLGSMKAAMISTDVTINSPDKFWAWPRARFARSANCSSVAEATRSKSVPFSVIV